MGPPSDSPPGERDAGRALGGFPPRRKRARTPAERMDEARPPHPPAGSDHAWPTGYGKDTAVLTARFAALRMFTSIMSA